MIKALLLAAAFAASVAGLGWFALAIDVHWQQVRGGAAPSGLTTLTLRMLGSAALGASLLLCLRADHASMASLVWVMALVGGALIVALMLSWRPRWLAPLVAWAGR